MINRWRGWARQLKRQTLALYFAYRHPQTPWVARLVAAVVVAYAFSPIDLIPDFIPVLGLLDDLVLLPLGVMLALRLIPAEVWRESQAAAEAAATRPTNWTAAAVIVVLWLAGVALTAVWLFRRFQ